MSVRLEWRTTDDCGGFVAVRGAELSDGQLVTAEAALQVGPLVVEGSLDALQLLAADLLAKVSDARQALS